MFDVFKTVQKLPSRQVGGPARLPVVLTVLLQFLQNNKSIKQDDKNTPHNDKIT